MKWPGACTSVKIFGYFLHPLDGEGGISDGLHGDGHELHRIVVCRYAVGTHHCAAAAAVDDCPLAVLTDPYCHGFHQFPAVCLSVTGFYIQMQTVQAVGTMISVIGPSAAGRDEPSAVFACKAFFTGMGLIIAFFVFFLLLSRFIG